MDNEVGLGRLLIDGHLGREDAACLLPADLIPPHEPFDLDIGGDIDDQDLVNQGLEMDLEEEGDHGLDDPLRVFVGQLSDPADKSLQNAGMGDGFEASSFFRVPEYDP